MLIRLTRQARKHIFVDGLWVTTKCSGACRAFAKAGIIRLYCHGLLSVGLTQSLVDTLGLGDA